MRAWLQIVLARVTAWLRREKADLELEAEWQSHLELLTDENLDKGMSPDAARRDAHARLGSLAPLSEAHREIRGLPWLDTVLQDTRYAFRTMRRDFGFSVFAILILGLGIGASATVFSVIQAIFLRPLPFDRPAELVWISNDTGQPGLSSETVPVNFYLELRRQSRSLRDLAAFFAFYGTGDAKLTGDGEPIRLSAIAVSCNFFDVLGVVPQRGRSFEPIECQGAADVPQVIVISHRLWAQRFQMDPSILGRRIVLNESTVTVAGVLPATFDFGSVLAPGNRIDIFSPVPLTADFNRRGNTLSMIGRLRPEVAIGSAQGDLDAVAPAVRRLDPGRVFRPKAIGLDERVNGRVRKPLLLLVGAVGVLMLIVCANLSNLLLARTAARSREMAIRAAIGAGSVRLIRQLLTESLVLAAAGALLGGILALAATRTLASLDSYQIPLMETVRLDGGVLAFTCLLAVATGVGFGLAPALRTHFTQNLGGAMKDGGRGQSGGRRSAWIRNALVVSEVGLACVLLVTAGLLIRSFLRVLDVDLGFRPEQTAAIRVDPSRAYGTVERRDAYFTDVLTRISLIPGVQSAGLTDSLPLGSNRSWSAGAKGKTYTRENPPPETFVRIITEGYFQAMGIPLRSGRGLSARDNPESKPVIVINETLAKALWPGENPIGQTVVYVDRDREVVGVVADVRHLALEDASGAEMYIPMRQTRDYRTVELAVRGILPPAALAPAIRAALSPLDPNLPTNEIRTIQGMVDRAVSPRRFVVLLLAAFSAFAVVLASLGIYAVISYMVSQRTQEIGIRLALGMPPAKVMREVLVSTMRLAGIGIAAGVAVSLGAAQAMNALLFGVPAVDWPTYAAMLVVLTAVALMAGYFPARRATRIDPLVALRAE